MKKEATLRELLLEMLFLGIIGQIIGLFFKTKLLYYSIGL